ncbi:MAG TPA: hypothetical protein VGN20_26580 [Mucilaginibacter sp.]|jgi:hypothetical protein
MPRFLMSADLSQKYFVEDICDIKQNIMTTLKINSTDADSESSSLKNNRTWQKWTEFADSQSKNRMMWFLIAFVFQAVIFLPIPAALMYYYNAPVVAVAVTVPLFFGFMVIGMCGFGIRTLISYTALCVVMNLAMVAFFVL